MILSITQYIVATLFTLADCRVNFICIVGVDRLTHPLTLDNISDYKEPTPFALTDITV